MAKPNTKSTLTKDERQLIHYQRHTDARDKRLVIDAADPVVFFGPYPGIVVPAGHQEPYDRSRLLENMRGKQETRQQSGVGKTSIGHRVLVAEKDAFKAHVAVYDQTVHNKRDEDWYDELGVDDRVTEVVGNSFIRPNYQYNPGLESRKEINWWRWPR
ncbi:hypothetical protein BKA67DRAFT_689574 [Truncatella angustata]|uniref:Uncharacterized protein n=1 Tax=Truncatella angustata TaxID=152316 RepID=A0A9P8USS9_9PEZI|nr:uncharacterized protein BKA67DRAFT_689574 [Truncatella angustata]KAH6658435.1 hypothetical protein BKA67DRAFT_689574 [Truncatella angustata]